MDAPSTINGWMINACITFTRTIIPTIQMRSDDGFSSSSSNFILTSASRTEGDMIAIASEIITRLKMPKMVSETGFCVMSEMEVKMTFAIEENIVNLSI